MALFKAVKKPVIRQVSSDGPGASDLRPVYTPKVPPCTNACPIGTDVRAWLATIADGEVESRSLDQSLETAWKKITARNPFPAVTGRLCDRPCEESCHRNRKDGAVAVRSLECYVGDYGIAQNLQFVRPKEMPERIAVCGSGPAGLSAAYHFARRGYRVTVFEASDAAGGVMRNAPAEVLDAEIRRIVDLGVELRFNCAEPDGEFAAVVQSGGLESPSLSTAIAQGMNEADGVILGLRHTAPPKPAARSVIVPDKVKLEWYGGAPRTDAAVTAESVVGETRRCMSCGTCMACGNCWMYCSHGCFEKLAAGRRYRMKLDLCNGCKKCADACPSGFIEMADKNTITGSH